MALVRGSGLAPSPDYRNKVTYQVNAFQSHTWQLVMAPPSLTHISSAPWDQRKPTYSHIHNHWLQWDAPTSPPKLPLLFVDKHSHLIDPFLDQPHLPLQTASGSNQPFCHNTLCKLTDRQTGRQMVQANVPSHIKPLTLAR